MDMTALEIARAFAEMGQSEDASRAYALVARDDSAAPEERLEAAMYLLQAGGDYKAAYDCMLELYAGGSFREDILGVLTEAFYEPNTVDLKSRYERNVKLLSKYPYLFRKDFLAFEKLPVRFYPYDDDRYVPFDVNEERFGELAFPKNAVISHYFFRNLDKPVLAQDIYSQYELEYLRDNVRRSEDVGYENHVYLHYADWGVFCSWLQVLNVKPLLEDKKLVFLIENELEQYPIDFKERFHTDYSGYAPRPVGIKEITRMIWHTQMSSHNGGDFFNEVFDAHPNLLAMPSVMLEDMDEYIALIRKGLKTARNIKEARQVFSNWENPRVVEELYRMHHPTEKDMLVAYYLSGTEWTCFFDPASRIAPAVFFQPHFHNIEYYAAYSPSGYAMIDAKASEEIRRSPIFKGFKYVKTFTPMRRFTTSYAATMRFALTYSVDLELNKAVDEEINEPVKLLYDIPLSRVLNRSFMRDPRDRLYRDSIVVRFEDGKLNPKATFTALAAFLDLPYTESMTYCSEMGNAHFRGEGNELADGFNPVTVYRTYDEYANDSERRFIEYFLRDAYEFYGYDFQYFDGQPADEEQIKAWLGGFDCFEGWFWNVAERVWRKHQDDMGNPEPTDEQLQAFLAEAKQELLAMREKRMETARELNRELRFVNEHGELLQMTPMLKPDPALLEQPLYH